MLQSESEQDKIQIKLYSIWWASPVCTWSGWLRGRRRGGHRLLPGKRQVTEVGERRLRQGRLSRVGDLISFDVCITVITLTASQTTRNEISDMLHMWAPLPATLAVSHMASLLSGALARRVRKPGQQLAKTGSYWQSSHFKPDTLLLRIILCAILALACADIKVRKISRTVTKNRTWLLGGGGTRELVWKGIKLQL